MGIDAYCEGIYARFGSYSFVSQMKFHLIVALKDFLELDPEFEYGKKDELISILVDSLSEGDEYYHLPFEKQHAFYRKNLDGFFPFIIMQDQGEITSYEADRFLQTFDIVKDYVHHSLLDENDNFYLDEIMKLSKESGESITFS
jgi:hypothetical protein